MSILQRSASPQAPAAASRPGSDRLRVITAGRVGNMEARLGTSGFDVVAAAETEDALMDAVSVDEPDAIVVEADLCDSLEHVRDLAPDAVLIVVGDHTPAGALGRVERGMSGTAMAGLLHALVAEGVGAAVVWGLVPTFRTGGALHVHHKARGTRDHGEHGPGDRFREPCGGHERAQHARTAGAHPRCCTDRGARGAASGRRCIPHDANTRARSLEERGRGRRPTGAEPRSVQGSWSSRPSTERCLAAARRGSRLGSPAAQACRQGAPQGVG